MPHALRLIYRSRSIQYPLIAAIKATNGWERAGIDIQSINFVSGAAKSDTALMNGECDFIFGSHITPYIHRYNGKPFVYLGQTVNWSFDLVASREPINSLKDLEGKRLSVRPGVTADRHHGNHPSGNRLLFLRRDGADAHKIDLVQKGDEFQVVLDGEADAVWVSPPDDEAAAAAGLHIFRPDPLPMVQASTMTTLWPILQQRPELCEAVLKAVLMGVHFIKTQPDAMWKVMQEDVAKELKIEDEKLLRHLHDSNRSILEPRLYPRAEAVLNAFELAVMEQPEIRDKVNPMSLWNIHLLRGIEESGYIDELYSGNVPPQGVPYEVSKQLVGAA